MKPGDLVKMTRKKWQASGTNSYLGIFIEEKWDEWFVECFGGKRVALVIAVAHKGSEIRVRFLRDLHTRWLAVECAEVLSEGR